MVGKDYNLSIRETEVEKLNDMRPGIKKKKSKIGNGEASKITQ